MANGCIPNLLLGSEYITREDGGPGWVVLMILSSYWESHSSVNRAQRTAISTATSICIDVERRS